MYKTLLKTAIVIIWLLSCGCAERNLQSNLSHTYIPTTSSSEQLNVRLSQSKVMFKKPFPMVDYKIGPEDLLEINVFQVKELKTIVRVTSEGYIKFPMVGKIKASGMTVSELEDYISKKLERYIVEPLVSVFVKEYRSQQITVLGAVKNPQVYTVTGQKYLVDVLSMAGGLTEEAGDICVIQKVVEGASGEVQGIQKIVIDLRELLINGNSSLNIPLSSGDVVHVPKRGVFFVDGAVNNPGSFPIEGKMTLVQAISMAKGLKYEADKSSITIYRDTGKSERELITVNYNDIINGKGADIFIQDKDIIIVPKSGVKNFLKGFVNTIRGFISFGKSL
jgi:polysaccharide export outer membrane protein